MHTNAVSAPGPDLLAQAAGRPASDLPAALVRLARLVQGVLAGVAAEHELTAAQARALCVLAEGPQAMSRLAAVLGVEKAAMTGLVDRLERRSLVERLTGADRRRFLIQLTPAGQARAVAVHEETSRRLEAMVGNLPASRRDRFCLDLGALVDG
ncbi:MAG: MarR family winged helix-turn-helix transcriptional regulator [Streptosporangiaceae bacterium]